MKAEPGTASAPASPPQDGLPSPRRFAAIAAVSLGTALTTVDSAIVNIALPTLARDLHVQPSAAVLVITVYQLVLMMTLLPFSALGDRFGHRTIYQYGQMLFVVATVLCFFAKSLPFLVLVRGIQALGTAAVMSVASAMIRSIYPASRLGRGLSLNTAIATVAAALAPTLGGVILAVADWPWLFAASIPLGILSILIGRRTLPDPHPREEPFDVLGAVLCAATFGLAITGLETAVHGDSPVISAALVLAGVGIGVFFVRRELRQARPVLPVDLLGERKIALASAGSLAAFIASMILMLSLPFRLQQEYGFTPAQAGAMLAVWPTVMMVAAPISGILSDRIPAGILGGIGMGIAACGMTGLALLPDAPSHFDIVWRVALCGLGFSMFFSPNARQIVGSAPVERAAAAGGLVSTNRMAGQTLGATSVAAMLAAGYGTGATPFFAATGLGLLAGAASFVVLRPKLRRPAPEDIAEL